MNAPLKKKLRISEFGFLLIVILILLSTSCKKKEDPSPAFAVTTSTSVKSITGTQAKLEGEVTGDGGNTVTERGFCGSLNPNPVVNNQSKIKAGSGVGVYSTTYKSFQPNTKYYVRAYAINSSGEIVYGQQISFSTGDLEIGDPYQGGIVFYINPSNTSQGLVAADANIPATLGWGINTINVSTGTTNGTGQSNTTAIVNAGAVAGNAAYECDAYSSGGYSDWYLPSKDELLLMNINLSLNGLGNFTSGTYWSSSQATAGVGLATPQELAITVDFPAGTVSSYMRGNNYPIMRPVRSF